MQHAHREIKHAVSETNIHKSTFCIHSEDDWEGNELKEIKQQVSFLDTCGMACYRKEIECQCRDIRVNIRKINVWL